MHILLDMDGVLADFVGGIFRAHGLPNLYDLPINKGKYRIEEVVSMTTAELYSPCGRAEFWAELNLCTYADDIVAAVTTFDSGVAICSSPMSGPSYLPSIRGKNRWLNRNYPASFPTRHFTRDKHHMAHPTHVLVDDYEANIDRFRQSGGQVVLIPAPWNHLWNFKGDIVTYLLKELSQIEERIKSAAVESA